MAALTTCISEVWIRDRVGLTHENLDDVKSLSLPGTYHEKITSLGDSLKKFTRLKNLDLSRNSLDTLKGLESCSLLENLNLYYNCLNTLEDLAPLRHNQKVISLDLRLNPVARTEADYRLFVISILPNLRTLDDRPVRESEREAAATLFGAGSNGKTAENKTCQPQQNSQPKLPSTTRIVPSGAGFTTMDADDRAVLDMLARQDEKPQENTGSTKTRPEMEEYQIKELRSLGEEELALRPIRKEKSEQPSRSEEMEGQTAYYKSKYPNIPTHRLAEVQDHELAQQEAEAYTVYKGQGHFTANPEHETREAFSERDNDRMSHSSGSNDLKSSSNNGCGNNSALIALLDLVDKYWNGFKSLHDNKKFMKLASDLHNRMNQEGTSALKAQIDELQQENARLMTAAKSNEGLKKVRIKFDESQVEMDKLRQKVLDLQEENSRIRMNAYSMDTADVTKVASGGGGQELERLKHENYQLQIKLKQYSQMSELARMLQESHKSLVQTNDHLLREIEDMRGSTKPHERKSNGNQGFPASNGDYY